VGPSGSGKSTIFQLLQRFYDFEGEIYIDGVEIRDYDIHHLRSHFVAVNQEPSLFTGSIASNIRYNLQAEEAELVEAATNAESIQFIRSKEGGFDADVGVMGSQLSGGQKQRVSMARAMIRKPQILILDEATSALDRMTEKKMQ
jgi:ABC-type multidrug transport system fused ATPase/permease subunit